eukprot:gene12984-27404_t
MFKRAASKSILRATGSQPIRIAFNVEVKEVVGPYLKEITSNSLISICIERGSKTSSSKEVQPQPVQSSPGLWRAEFNETISVVTTLFRDSAGLFQDKKAKLVVRYRKKTLLGGDSFKPIGEASMKLHTIAFTLGEAFQGGVIGLPLTKCSMEGATLYVRITATAVGEGGYGDETQSVASGISEKESVDENKKEVWWTLPEGRGSASIGMTQDMNSNYNPTMTTSPPTTPNRLSVALAKTPNSNTKSSNPSNITPDTKSPTAAAAVTTKTPDVFKLVNDKPPSLSSLLLDNSKSMNVRTESDDNTHTANGSGSGSTGVGDSTRIKALLLEMEAMRMDVLDANKRA